MVNFEEMRKGKCKSKKEGKRKEKREFLKKSLTRKKDVFEE
jgi:hypothetical protein